MKYSFLVSFILAFGCSLTQAAVVYSGLQNVPITVDQEGAYLNLASGTTSSVYPGLSTWDSGPWLNLFFGGVAVGNSPYLRPVITGSDQIVALPYGTLVDGSSNFAPGESGSSSHIGPAPNQFQIGVDGYMAFAFQTGAGQPTYYGWLRFAPDNSTGGVLRDWAFESTVGLPVAVGFTVTAPEPSRSLLLLAGGVVLLARRQRRENR